ncbi:hypothetical protein [Spiroplasma culicicola]|uniref:Uncharacterized protein n=1 Tax=Spiroplasma culicicola AES-1 TaxID=1276246 RepID=W6AG09_9MOLU|nr:hypothetical protein [Spiroplasma culicicola]AHI52644.1 hypothetical protein SCULI_v1c03030 [Spiroplasma culicicola AES-1]
MSEKITLKDIVEINKVLTKQEYTSHKEFEAYLDVIGEYIDDTFFKQDVIIERLLHYSEQSYRFLDININKNWEVELSTKHVHDYLSNCRRAIEKSLFGPEQIFDLSIFVEIKSIVGYFLEKVQDFDSLRDYETLYSINTVEFHQQNETFKYLYTAFDKFTYIARHLNDKYFKKVKSDLSEENLKFFTDFARDISFLTVDAKAYTLLNDTIETITYSKAWHYIRRLRNNLEHDFADPLCKYNITFSIELLFIIIGRIMLVLNKTLKNEIDIRKTLEELKNS